MGGFQRHWDFGGKTAPNPLYPASLAAVTTLQGLIDHGVERAITLWPEWGVAFTHLDKRVENRPMKPPKGLVGRRIAFHMGAYVGGRKGNPAHNDGMTALTETAKSAGWQVRLIAGQHGRSPMVEFCKSDKVIRLDAIGADHPPTPGVIKIVRSAITFTGIISGFTPPTDTPTMPWQIRSDPDDPESWSYAWHIEDVVPLAKPIPCAGIQGFWPLSRLVKP